MEQNIRKTLQHIKFVNIEILRRKLDITHVKYFMQHSVDFGYYKCQNCLDYVRADFYNHMTHFCFPCEENILKEADGAYDTFDGDDTNEAVEYSPHLRFLIRKVYVNDEEGFE